MLKIYSSSPTSALLKPTEDFYNIIIELTELSKEEYIHPYLDDKIGFHFAYVPTSKGHAVVVEKNQDVDDDYFRKVQNTLDLFEIKSVYVEHSIIVAP